MSGRIHGMSETRTYSSWVSMHGRCRQTKDKGFKYYGGRGISVCPEWTDFTVFLRDMGERPPGRSLDRIDNDLGYSASNCRWATRLEQGQNRRSARLLTAFGETHCIAEWSRRLGFTRGLVYGRLSLGWSAERALSTPKMEAGR